MAKIEAYIKTLAILIGVITLSAPILSVVQQSRRPKGISSGKAASSRNWPGVLLITVVFVVIGFVLWRPFPFRLTKQQGEFLSAIGAIIYFPGVSLYLWGLVTLRSQFGVSGLFGAELYKEHELIMNGPFAIIRHPMYVGVLLAALGALLVFRTWAMMVFMPMSLVVVARAEREEKLLEQEFGDEWRVYASKVPKWLPKL
jgi:protein-S-isoprenylcysteine O-methyltransferase Ste14